MLYAIQVHLMLQLAVHSFRAEGKEMGKTTKTGDGRRTLIRSSRFATELTEKACQELTESGVHDQCCRRSQLRAQAPPRTTCRWQRAGWRRAVRVATGLADGRPRQSALPASALRICALREASIVAADADPLLLPRHIAGAGVDAAAAAAERRRRTTASAHEAALNHAHCWVTYPCPPRIDELPPSLFMQSTDIFCPRSRGTLCLVSVA